MSTSCLIPIEDLVTKRQTNLGEFGDDGFPVKPFFDETCFKGNVQPITGFEILQVEEGDRTRQNLNIFTEFELKSDDIVVRKGIEYEVRTVEHWDIQVSNLSHFKARVVKVDVKR